jgi:hypothetical protein
MIYAWSSALPAWRINIPACDELQLAEPTDDCVDPVADCGHNEDPSKNPKIPGIGRVGIRGRLFWKRGYSVTGHVAQLQITRDSPNPFGTLFQTRPSAAITLAQPAC